MTTNPHWRADAARPSRLSAFLGLEAGEPRPVASMIGLNFAVSAAFVLVQTSAFGLFIEAFGSHALPYAYFSVAILSSLIAYLFLQASQRVSFARSLYINLGFLAGMCLVFWLGLRSEHSRWFIFLLPFWFQTLVNLANLVVWHLAGHMFHVRQAKRIFGLIVGGNWIANIVGGVLIAAFLGSSSPSELYLFAAIALGLSMLVLRAALANYRAPAAAPGSGRPSQESRRLASRAALAHPYGRLIFAYTLLWWLAFFILENIFFHEVEGRLESSAALASFLGWQLAVMGVIALFTTLVLTSRVARRYGLRLGLLVMPVIVTLAILLLAVGGALGWGDGFLFWTAAVARTLNVALGFSLSLAMGSLLFQPLQGHLRGAAQTIAEGIIQPLAIGAAGVILLVFNTTLGLDAVGLSCVFLVVAIPWIWSVFALARRYPLVMSDALKKRALGESTTVLFDGSAVELLRRALQQPQAGQALYALSQLEQIAPEAWPQVFAEELPKLLQHPAVEVRLEALQRVLKLPLMDCAGLLRDRLQHELEPRTMALLIRILATIQDPGSVERVAAAAESQDRTVQAGAIVGLLSVADAGINQIAAARLQKLVESPDVEDRLAACSILGELRHFPVIAATERLLRDDALDVRQAALRAARRHFDPSLIRPVLDACADPACSRLAEGVLAEFGALDSQALLNEARVAVEEGSSSRIAHSMIRVLGRMTHPDAVELLVSAFESPDPQFRQQALLSLSRCGYRGASLPESLRRVHAEVMHAAWIAAALQREDALRGWATLRSALEIEFGDTRGRILLLLSFIYDSRAVLLARNALGQAGSVHSAMALETIDALLPTSLKPLLLPLLEDLPHDGRLARWGVAGVHVPALGDEEVLGALLDSEAARSHSAWTRMCAMHVIGHAEVNSFRSALERASGSAASQPALDRMRLWALARLASPHAPKGDGIMLSLVERVLTLKSAPLFAGTSDAVLAELAGLVEEVSFDTDQVVFHKGDPGDSLYVIISGSVKVWDGDRLLNELTEGEAFGELALLDPEPRLGTVKAAEPTHLLRLDSPSFREVLDSQPEVSSAILRVVTKYLRSQLQYAREASERLRALESLAPLTQSDGR
jgi:AAA family ATP:ADP antiporter